MGMDIPQPPAARAALTLSKDMTFRDYAQGAFRMRGIGAGQRIELIAIPEVQRLIQDAVGTAAGGSPEPPPSAEPSAEPAEESPLSHWARVAAGGAEPDGLLAPLLRRRLSDVEVNARAAAQEAHERARGRLRHVVLWLHLNSMQLEKMQFRLLCEQTLSNLWRKEAYRRLLKRHEELDGSRPPESLQNCIDVFREKVALEVGEYATLDVSGGVVVHDASRRMTDSLLGGGVERLVTRKPEGNFIGKKEREVAARVFANLGKAQGEAPGRVAVEASQLRDHSAEQEQEQEMEQEEMLQMESLQQDEEEHDEVDDVAEEKLYATDSQEQLPWPVEQLGSVKARSQRPFYPLSDFRVFASLSASSQLAFPPYLYLSANYYNPAWWREPRRLKNIIMMMEWVPNAPDGERVPHAAPSEPPPPLSAEQLQNLRAAFNMIDKDGSRLISEDEFNDLLTAVGERVGEASGGLSREQVARLFREADSDHSGGLTFENVCRAVQQQRLFEVQDDRYFVGISLAEAEGLRALLHAQQAQGLPLLAGRSASVALRHGSLDFEASLGFQPATDYQRRTAYQCFRLFDAEVDFSYAEVQVVLRALQSNAMKRRREWYEAVRSCRRRPRRDWRTAPVARIFEFADEYHLLPAAAARHKILTNLGLLRMDPRAFFRQCDSDGDGQLSTAELNGGLAHLRIPFEEKEVHALFELIDSDRSGEWLGQSSVGLRAKAGARARAGAGAGTGVSAGVRAMARARALRAMG